MVEKLRRLGLEVKWSKDYGWGLYIIDRAVPNQRLWDIGPATVTMQQIIQWVYVEKSRKIYEFLAIGKVVNSRTLTEENKDIMWVDLVKVMDPAIFMNSANKVKQSNISVHPHRTKKNYATARADSWIDGGVQLTDFYAAEGDDVDLCPSSAPLVSKELAPEEEDKELFPVAVSQEVSVKVAVD